MGCSWGHRDHDTLTHPATELMRYLSGTARGRDLTFFSIFRARASALPAGPAVEPLVKVEGLHLLSDRVDRVERGQGSVIIAILLPRSDLIFLASA